MSQYTHIFLNKGQEFIEVSCMGRSSALSEIFGEFAPWEKIRRLSTGQLHRLYQEYKGEYKKWAQHKEKTEARKALVATFNNSVDEKMTEIRQYDESLDEIDETMEELQYALMQVSWLTDISESGAASVWVGCECGSDVTYKDNVDYVEMDLKPAPEEDT